MKVPNTFCCVFAAMIMASCGTYKQNVMFRADNASPIRTEALKIESNYVIAKDDQISLKIYTNKGEMLVDPNLESFKEGTSTAQSEQIIFSYQVNANGEIKFPLIGEIQVEGITLKQAEELLQEQYSEYYEEPFVMLKFLNKRVIVLGSSGGQVIPLENENMKLTEVLALSKSIHQEAKAHNIRVLRKDQLFIVDFSTFEGYTKHNMAMQPGDVVYVEPVRKPFVEAIREYGPVFSTLASLGTLVVVIIGLN